MCSCQVNFFLDRFGRIAAICCSALTLVEALPVTCRGSGLAHVEALLWHMLRLCPGTCRGSARYMSRLWPCTCRGSSLAHVEALPGTCRGSDLAHVEALPWHMLRLCPGTYRGALCFRPESTWLVISALCLLWRYAGATLSHFDSSPLCLLLFWTTYPPGSVFHCIYALLH